MDVPKIERRDWMDAVERLTTRAEDLKDTRETFFGEGLLSAIRTACSQLVYGRRGTGKTHLFLRFRRDLEDRFDADRQIGVYVDCAALHEQDDSTREPLLSALHQYCSIIGQALRTLGTLTQDLIKPSTWDSLVRGRDRQRLEQAVENLSAAERLLSRGEVRFVPMGVASAQTTTVDEMTRGTDRSLSFETTAALANPAAVGVRLSAGSKNAHNKSAASSIVQDLDGDIVVPFDRIARIILEILDLLGDAKLVILLDEWSQIRPRVQPILAQLLKVTLRRRMWVKIAAVPGRTELFQYNSDGQSLGMELNDDIVADIDLDTALTAFTADEFGHLASFYLSVLHRHLSEGIPAISEVSLDSFAALLLSDYVEDRAVLAELFQAPGGIVRDFLSTFQQATRLQASSSHVKIRMVDVRRASLTIYQGRLSNARASSSDDLRILDRLHRVVFAGKRSYYFLVNSREAWHPVLLRLFTAKLIHKTPWSWQDPDEGSVYIWHQLDYSGSLQRDAEATSVTLTTLGVAARVAGLSIGGGLLVRAAAVVGIAGGKLIAQEMAIRLRPPLEVIENPRDVVVSFEELLEGGAGETFLDRRGSMRTSATEVARRSRGLLRRRFRPGE